MRDLTPLLVSLFLSPLLGGISAAGLLGSAMGAMGGLAKSAGGGGGGDDKQGGRCQQVMYFAPAPWMQPCPPATHTSTTTKVQPVYVPAPGYQPVAGLPAAPQYPFGMPYLPQLGYQPPPVQHVVHQVLPPQLANPLLGGDASAYM